jgi:outer membrane receptor protein involved in Fe transport
LNYTGLHERDMLFVTGKYTHFVSDTLKTSLAARYNHFDQAKGDIGYFPFPGFGGHDPSTVDMQLGGFNFNTELQVEAKLSSKWSNISGFVYEKAKSEEYQFVWQDDESIHPFSAYLMKPGSSTVSGYSQFQFKPKDSIQTVAGLRLVKNSDVKDVFFSPRLGLIYSFRDNYYFKVLYGKAFRIPNFFEKYVSTYNVLYGSLDLEPESLQSFDIALESHFDKLKAKLNGFVSLTDQGISRVPTDNPEEHGSKAAMYVNSAALTMYGIEASLSAAIRNDSYFGTNVGWKDGKDDQTGEKLMYFAKVTSNAWLNYDVFPSLSVTPMVQYIGKREGISAKDGRYEIDPYVLFNLSAAYKFNRFSIIATGKNLFNSDYVYPEFVRRNVREIPGGPGRSFRVSMRFEM